ncbi:UNVERIFIED_CONTAM: UDP-glycosyltransferase 71E1 [Sesamum angustifolium]|uniref:UDP-glycosyltransferase 71E1 n=1 Tax=Sesamum angustifolium TaxID=2727405 RepID=A0AAW2KNB5_9LAMI
MSGKTKAELVFIPSPGRGHLLATVDMAKLLIDRDERLSVTVIVIKPSFDSNSSAHSYAPESNSRIRFIGITNANPLSMSMSSPLTFHEQFIENHKDPAGAYVHFQGLRDYQNQDVTVYENSSEELSIPSYKLPVPAKLLPALMFNKDGGSSLFLDYAKRFRETKGIVVNTFLELESHAMKSLSEDETSHQFTRSDQYFTQTTK